MRTTPLPVGRFGRFLRLRILLMSLLTYDLVMNLKLTIDDTYFPSAVARRRIHYIPKVRVPSIECFTECWTSFAIQTPTMK